MPEFTTADERRQVSNAVSRAIIRLEGDNRRALRQANDPEHPRRETARALVEANDGEMRLLRRAFLILDAMPFAVAETEPG